MTFKKKRHENCNLFCVKEKKHYEKKINYYLNSGIMETTHQSKFIKSSNLLFITAGLILISSIITRIFNPPETNSLFIIILNLVIIISVGLIVRQGLNWSKYLPLVLLILYFIEASSFLFIPEANFITKIIFVAQLILVTTATLNLFLNFPKKSVKIELRS